METVWTPSSDLLANSQLSQFHRFLADRGQVELGLSYDELQRWSTANLEQFWASLADWADVQWRTEPHSVFGPDGPRLPGTEWFPGAQLNYAEHALAHADRQPEATAIVTVLENGARSAITWAELARQVAACRQGLLTKGVTKGDRVVGYLPNVAEAAVAMLACASLGAIWASCPPEFGTQAVIDRFSQIEPKVLLAADGYHYRGKPIDRSAEVARLQAELTTLEAIVSVQHLARTAPGQGPEIASAGSGWEALLAETGPLDFEPVAFDHPLYVLSSSGTTGLPKPIVHGHGGITLEHLRVLRLHQDMSPSDTFFWFTTTGWMMWNYLISGLLAGATVVAYDGDPAHPDLSRLWQLAADEQVTVFGAGAPLMMACRKAGLEPGRQFDLSALRSINSTGAPLPAAGFRWKVEAVSATAQPGSVSGGTDVCTAFLGMAPTVPVRAGLISVRGLGCAVAAADEQGQEQPDGETGELVLTAPMPSMPVGFWNDDDGSRYRRAYFERFEGLWCHGDWITFDPDGGCEISGRSDATLNRGGVRLGTSDLYRCVEDMPQVTDSLVVHLEASSANDHEETDDDGLGLLVLFVALAAGEELTAELERSIRTRLRTELSPRHVPDRIAAIRAVPRTLSGKKLEVPVKKVLLGAPAADVAALDALADPNALLELEALVGSIGF